MATLFPGALDNFTNPTGTDLVTNPDHGLQHANANDAIEAIEAKVGTGASTPVANRILLGNGIGTSTWGQVDLSTETATGVLPLANGGTAANTAPTARTNLGLGSIATQNSDLVSITGGAISNSSVSATTLSSSGNTTIGDASGDTLTINSLTVNVPNNLNFDTDTFFIDAVNNRIGLGTNTPNFRISLEGTDVETSGFFSNRTSDNVFSSTIRGRKLRTTGAVNSGDRSLTLEGLSRNSAGTDNTLAQIIFETETAGTANTGMVRFNVFNGTTLVQAIEINSNLVLELNGGFSLDVSNVTNANFNFGTLATSSSTGVLVNGLTAARTVTLPSAATAGIGYLLTVGCGDGTCTVVNTISIIPSGAETISGAASVTLITAYAHTILMSNGTNWVIISNV